MSVGVWHTDKEGRLGRDRLIRKGKYSEQEQFAPLHNRPARKTTKKKKKNDSEEGWRLCASRFRTNRRNFGVRNARERGNSSIHLPN